MQKDTQLEAGLASHLTQELGALLTLNFRPTSEKPTADGDYIIYNQCDGYHVVSAWIIDGEFEGFHFFADKKTIPEDWYCAWALLPCPNDSGLFEKFARKQPSA
ncbi:MAG: hypothetical protein Q7S87_04765 [Agitococcus sp.]|nr:hypothetical protein [Agitococcus sp.]